VPLHGRFIVALPALHLIKGLSGWPLSHVSEFGGGGWENWRE
jgi:hypothetical protein